jgi:hypothetical protein
VERILNSVLFPLPFGPRRPKISPGETEKEIPARASRVP